MADGGDHHDGFLNKVRTLNARVKVDLNRRLRRREIQAQLSETSTEDTVTTNTLKLCSTFASSRTATSFRSRTPRTTRANPSRPAMCPDERDNPNDDDTDTEMNNSHSEASDTTSHYDVLFPDGLDSVDNTNNETLSSSQPPLFSLHFSAVTIYA